MLLGLILPAVLAFAQAGSPGPIKTAVCEVVRHPADFEGKLVQIRATVESGVDDLPAGLTDEGCGAEIKFFTPDDPHFARLLKSKGFRTLTKEVKRNPVVQATVNGWFKRTATDPKPEYGLALESVSDVVVKRPPGN
ncbi:MAG TPA: hypothetical protein VKR61_02510 [Bryobacteraceae bacterium]|nr:hypothetical protein [Bryobacteraceae bacterium]